MTVITTLASWKQNIAIRLSTAIPTLSVDTGITLADNYLSQTGGWTPVNPGAPTDIGRPASGLTDDAIVALILTQIKSSQYEFRATLTLPVSLTLYVNLTPGLSAEQVRDASAAAVRAYLDKVTAALPIMVDSAVLTYSSVNRTAVGDMTPTLRVSYNASIGDDPEPILSGALRRARAKFGLTNLWNYSTLYTSSASSIEAILIKYVDTTYSSVDTTETSRLVIGIDPYSGAVLSGILN